MEKSEGRVSVFAELYVGVNAKRIRKLFTMTNEQGKAILFIDEIDATGRPYIQGYDGKEKS